MTIPGPYSTRIVSINDWPGGPRRVACLRCDRRFVSRGKGHRLCGACRGTAAEEHDFRLTDPGHTPLYRQAA
jgi:hypothetical protein